MASYNPETYWDRVAETIDERNHVKIIAGDEEPYYRYKRKLFLKLLGSFDFENKSVLEVGSGPGGNLEFIYSKGCKKITGADISAQMIELARNNLVGKEISLVKTDGTHLPFADQSFDLVFTSTVLQHTTNVEILNRLIAEICRVGIREIMLFERIEKTIKGHESNLGRPVEYYQDLVEAHGFTIAGMKSLPLQASYYTCGAIRKLFNKASRKEGEPLTKFSLALQRLVLPLTSVLDRIILSRRDVMMLRFVRKAGE